jgi:hypothetical protein
VEIVDTLPFLYEALEKLTHQSLKPTVVLSVIEWLGVRPHESELAGGFRQLLQDAEALGHSWTDEFTLGEAPEHVSEAVLEGTGERRDHRVHELHCSIAWPLNLRNKANLQFY